MPEITYISADGETTVTQAAAGTSLMQAAVSDGVAGIVAECGGNLMCATCHVYVTDEWVDRVGPPGEEEDEMLDETVAPRTSASRLSCQIVLDDGHDGLVVRTPAEQD